MDQTIQKVQISAQFVEKDSTNQRISNDIYYLTHQLNRTNAIFAIGVSTNHAVSIKYLIYTKIVSGWIWKSYFSSLGFFQQCNLKRHMASHSVENGAQGFKCEHCSANFTTKSVLSVHLREAHGDKLVTKKEAQKAANASDKNLSNGLENFQQMIMKGPKVSRGFPQRYWNL